MTVIISRRGERNRANGSGNIRTAAKMVAPEQKSAIVEEAEKSGMSI